MKLEITLNGVPMCDPIEVAAGDVSANIWRSTLDNLLRRAFTNGDELRVTATCDHHTAPPGQVAWPVAERLLAAAANWWAANRNRQVASDCGELERYYYEPATRQLVAAAADYYALAFDQ